MTDNRCVLRVMPLLALALVVATASAQQPFSAADLIDLRSVTGAVISPDGTLIAGTVSRQRPAADEPGGNYSELVVWDAATGTARPFVSGKVAVREVQWSPDGWQISFLQKRGGDEQTQVWAIAIDGGEAVALTKAASDVLDYRWRPDGTALAYIAEAPASEREKELKKKGYDFVYFEENLRHRSLYLQPLAGEGDRPEALQLTDGMTVWRAEWRPDGAALALACSEKNLVDHEYMFQTVRLLDVASKAVRPMVDPGGKLGSFAWSPDGARLAYVAARERKDHSPSQLFVVDAAGGSPRNLTPTGFRGHVEEALWQDAQTIVYLAAEGVWNTLATESVGGDRRQVVLHGRDAGVVLSSPSRSRDGKRWAFIGDGAAVPADVYAWDGTAAPRKVSEVNPWLGQRTLGRQEVVRYRSRDGAEIEGLLVHPVGGAAPAPLVVFVHGGPEGHYGNGWVTRYAEPTQVLAAKGYAVFLPNYRSSTGYGLDHALVGFGDPAGREFDDVADGIDHLVKVGVADRQRVGLAGGSYGGYAAAWFATYYTRHVRAVCMFVGISDLVSKRATTDIPYEELYVHSGPQTATSWDLARERSPIFHATKSRSAVLIVGGTADTRVHPSQSLEFYRHLKMAGHPAVRLVQYPGEGHGNRKQPGRLDVLFRQLEWFDWYVRDAKPLDGPMPRLDISDAYLPAR
jgi:dipeptidyl aminopeptidase/acylaminoacyl peptidase